MRAQRAFFSWSIIGCAFVSACEARTGDPRHFEPDQIEQTLPKGDPGALNGQLDFCTGGEPCGLGEGDCDRDSECAPGLVCGYDNLELFLSGACSGCDACVSPHCRDGVQNADESGRDCGGAHCGACLDCPIYPNGAPSHCSANCPCPAGEGDCDGDAQCAPGLVCGLELGPQFAMPFGHDVCVTAHCADRAQNADETGIDCGGADCGSCITCSTTPGPNTCSPGCRCPAGLGDCDSDRECQSGLVCTSGISKQFGITDGFQVCTAAHCSNGVFDATSGETGIDCGGPCGQCTPVPKGLCRDSGWVSEVIYNGTLLELGTTPDNRVHVAFNSGDMTLIATREDQDWWPMHIAPGRATLAAFHPVTGEPYLSGYQAPFLAGFPVVAFRQSGPWILDSPEPWTDEWPPYLDSYSYSPAALTVGPTGLIRGVWDESLPDYHYYFFAAISRSPDGTWSHDGQVGPQRAPGTELLLQPIRKEVALGPAGELHHAFSYPGALIDRVILNRDYIASHSTPVPGEYGEADIAVDAGGTLLIAATGNAALDCSQYPHGGDELNVMLIKRSGDQWTSESVAPTGIFVEPYSLICTSDVVSPELALAPSGEPLICWLQPPSSTWSANDSQPVRCAWKQGDAYRVAEVIPEAVRHAPPGSWTETWNDIAIGVTPNGCCHIAYNAPDGALMYATDCTQSPVPSP